MDLGLKDKRALVCASSKGLGLAVAKALAEEGCELFLCARNAVAIEATAQSLTSTYGVTAHASACDLSTTPHRTELIEAVNAVWSEGPDCVIHNVGGPKPTTLMETQPVEWQTYFDQLFQSIIQLNQAFLPAMQKRHWGRIVIITSLSAFHPIPNLAISNTYRSAITAMAKTLADEIAAQGVTINCVAPGTIHTDRTEERIKDMIQRTGGTREEHLSAYAAEIPAKRLGTPQEFAAAVAFLCSQQASYITGSTLCVDGGRRRSYT